MSPKRVYWAMLAVTAVLMLALIGSAYGTKQLLQAKSTQLVKLKASLSGYDAQQSALVKAKKDITTYTELYDIAKVVVPESKDQAQAVRQIVKIADANSVILGRISFPTSTLGQAPGKVGAPASANSLGASAPTANSSTTSLSQLTPVTGSPGVYSLIITVTSDTKHPTTYPRFISFLAGLEQNRFTAEVTNITIVPDTNDPTKFTFTLNLNTYIKPS